ncbi:hypothetical protein BCR35DRAFT_287038 [Leucosporidium creatinivorum]|uniref:RecF/RecN/SMC N-terminal domain-containing protein n=1 Tax=Leucosporidium creatinivorum TaxID=106004 RepID=A0A1Y2G1M9_9BASI|nr:hypothetical protein BCR35DRAFT_287038 [Leucosporidium creatinivorum]
MSATKRPHHATSSDNEGDEEEVAMLLTSQAARPSTGRPSLTLRQSPAPSHRSKRARSSSTATTATLQPSRDASDSPQQARAAPAARPQYDPYHSSNANAVAGPSGLARAALRSSTASHRRRQPSSQLTSTVRGTPQQSTAASRGSRDVSVIVISDTSSDEEGAPGSAPAPTPRQQPKKARRPVLHEHSDDEEEEEDYAVYEKSIRRLLRKDRAAEIRQANRRGVLEEEEEQFNGRGARDAEKVMKAGTILEVTLQNFMCHKYFTLQPTSAVNFVTGPNGSGKSAVLAALTLCLGGKAVLTGRGSSLPELVGSNGDNAQVIVILSNTGPQAFEPKKLGDKIKIQRTIRKGGSSAFKISSASGETVGTTAAYVSQLTACWGLRIESPLTLLSQDHSRLFLKDTTPAQRFAVWLRASGLADVAQNLDFMETSLDQMVDTLGKKRPIVKELREEEKKCKELVKQATGIELARTELGEADAKLAWRKVQDHEKVVSRLNKKLVECEKDLATFKTGRQDAETQAQHDTDALRAAEAKRAQVEEQSQRATQELTNATAEREKKKKDKRDIQNSIRQINSDIAGHERESQEASQQIEELKANAPDQDRILAAQTELDNIDAQQEELKDKISTTEDSIAELQAEPNEEDPCADDIDNRNREIARARAAVVNAKGAIQDPLAVFGPEMRQLLQAIDEVDRHGGWHGPKPDGPIGRYITVNERQYQMAIEIVLGGVLSSFVVMDERDQRKLGQMCRGIGRSVQNVSVIRRNPDRTWELPRNQQPAPQHMTVLRAITFQRQGHEEAFRAVIDSLSPESVVLVEERSAGDVLMRWNKPRETYIKRCISAKAFELGSNQPGMDRSIALKMIPASQFRLSVTGSSANDAHQRVRLLETDVARLEGELTAARAQRRAWSNGQRQLLLAREQRIRALQQERNGWRRESEDLRRQALELQTELAENTEAPHALESLQTERDAAEAAREAAASQLEASQNRLQEITDELLGLDNLFKERQQLVNQWTDKLQKLAAKMDELSKLQAVSQQKVRDTVRSSGKLDARIAEAKTNLEQGRAELEEATAAAEQVGERRHVEEGLEALQKNLAKLKVQVDKARHLPAFDLNAAEDKYLAARNEVDNAVTALNSLRFTHKMLVLALQDRRQRWFEMRSLVMSSARSNFTNLMLEKTGKVASLKFRDVDDPTELHINVDFGDHGKKKGSKIELANRSGGERSMTQLYFMMSLWHDAESPFRALDEANVFLDDANNARALEALVKHGLQDDCQYIFLTPLSITLPPHLSARINIVRLNAPS